MAHIIDNKSFPWIDGWAPYRRGRFLAAKGIAVKTCVVTLGADERERLDGMTRSGKHSAQRLMKARILLKADASDGGEGLSEAALFV